MSLKRDVVYLLLLSGTGNSSVNDLCKLNDKRLS